MMSHASTGVLDVVIVGGGLSGMLIAHEMHKMKGNISWKLVEARPVVGGRLTNDDAGNEIDLGAAWFWPRYQPHLSRLVSDLSIPTFAQPDDPSSMRFVGGAVQLIHRLKDQVPAENILVNTAIKSCKLTREMAKSLDEQTGEGSPLVRLETENDDVYLARKVVFAAPPKPLSKNVSFDPPLSREKQKAMSESQTWMAGVTKVALTYPTRFWKDSNHASNMGVPHNFGPAFQVYDASPADERVFALTFFSLVSWQSPSGKSDETLAEECASQIQEVWSTMRLPDFAGQAKTYEGFHVQRWPHEKYISEDAKPERINPHPSPVRALSTKEWDGTLMFAGSEADTLSPGVMEGAVGSAVRVVRELKSFFSEDNV